MSIRKQIAWTAIGLGVPKTKALKLQKSVLDWLTCADVIAVLEQEAGCRYMEIGYDEAISILRRRVE